MARPYRSWCSSPFVLAVAFTSLVAGSCGSSEESADVPPDSSSPTTSETLPATEPSVGGATPTTVPMTSTVASIVWGPPLRVNDLGGSFGSPATASGLGVVIVTASGQEEGIEAATRVWFSLDALSWEPVDITGVRLRSVAAIGPGFVAVGRQDTDDAGPAIPAGTLPQPVPAVWTSADGRNWAPATSVDRGPFKYGEIADAAGTDAGLIAVGEAWTQTGQIHPAVWSSPDGLVWTMVPGDPLGTTEDRLRMKVAVGRGGIVAIGQTTPVESDGPGPVSAWWSPDGVLWDQTADTALFGPDLALGDLVAFGSGFALGGSRGAQEPLVWSSPDGRTWNDPVQLPTRPNTGSSFVRGLAADGSSLVVVGDDVIFDEGYGPATGDAAIWTSSGGNWIQVPPEDLRSDAVLDNVDATSVLHWGDGLIVLGTTTSTTETEVAGVIWYSN